MSRNELDNLSDTALDFFFFFLNFIQSFGNKLKLRDFANTWMVKDRLQDLDTVTCSIFQIYFHDNLFNPDEHSNLQNKTKLNKKTIEALLNELFVLDNQKQNETVINEYADECHLRTT